jgi:hypothetical protein
MPNREKTIENISKTFSFKLSEKLAKKEIDIEKMAVLINEFFVLANENDMKKINNFVENI